MLKVEDLGDIGSRSKGNSFDCQLQEKAHSLGDWQQPKQSTASVLLYQLIETIESRRSSYFIRTCGLYLVKLESGY